MLLASTWDLTGTRTIFARDAATGRWSGNAIAHSRQQRIFCRISAASGSTAMP
jgi:hypothetical protein